MTADSLPVAASTPRRWALAWRGARVIGWLAAVALCLALLAWFALQWAILPHADRWRPQIEAKTSIPGSTTVRSLHNFSTGANKVANVIGWEMYFVK